jgi:hypothetical protein
VDTKGRERLCRKRRKECHTQVFQEARKCSKEKGNLGIMRRDCLVTFCLGQGNRKTKT